MRASLKDHLDSLAYTHFNAEGEIESKYISYPST